MNQPAELRNATKAILNPAEHKQEWEDYLAAKRPAEELLVKLRKAWDEHFPRR